jgi:hypothetical protein
MLKDASLDIPMRQLATVEQLRKLVSGRGGCACVCVHGGGVCLCVCVCA